MRFSVGMSSFAEPLYWGLRPVQAICLYFAVSMEVVVGEVAELELLWNEEVVLSDNICKVGPLC